MEAESQSQYRGGGAVLHMSSEDGRRLCITGMSLVDPAHVRGERVVTVWAEVGQEKRAIDIGTLSSKHPAAVVSVVPPVVLAGEFVLRHDLDVAAAVRLNVRVLAPPDHQCSNYYSDEAVEAVLVLGVDNVEDVVMAAEDDEEDEEEVAAAAVGVEYEPMSEDDVAERYDSDNDEDDDVGVVRTRESSSTNRLVVVPDGELVGPARFAVVGNTAGFMRIADDDQESSSSNSSKDEIVVLYRYTRFSRPAGTGRRGVEACKRTKHHRLHFFTAGGDMASSLSWAGSSLAALIYPKLFRQELAELWTSLLSTATTNAAVLPGGGRLQVIVDVGILRREDYTADRMAHVRGELVHRVLEPWPDCSCCGYYHVDMELNLPEPVTVTMPAAKCRRRRIAGDEEDEAEEEEECCVCFEVMEYGYGGGVAAWPGCGHVFHGVCVQKTLERSEMCPLCRRRLSDPL